MLITTCPISAYHHTFTLVFTIVLTLMSGCQQNSPEKLITKQTPIKLASSQQLAPPSKMASSATTKALIRNNISQPNIPQNVAQTSPKRPLPCTKSLSPPIYDQSKLETMLIKTGKITSAMSQAERAKQVSLHIQKQQQAYRHCLPNRGKK